MGAPPTLKVRLAQHAKILADPGQSRETRLFAARDLILDGGFASLQDLAMYVARQGYRLTAEDRFDILAEAVSALRQTQAWEAMLAQVVSITDT